MSFKATLKLDNDDKMTFKVFTFDYSVVRSMDLLGRPTSIMYAAKMQIEIEHKPECVLLHDWAYKNYEMKIGSVVFMKRDDEAARDIEFKFRDAYISKIFLRFSNNDTNPMSEHLEIITSNIEIESQGKVTQYVIAEQT